MFQTRLLYQAALLLAAALTVGGLQAQGGPPEGGPGRGPHNNCGSLPNHAALQSALHAALTAESAAEGANSGLKNQMWATIVDRDGIVCAVAFSGGNRGAQWPGSRVISAQKANTANAFSLDSTSSSLSSNGDGQANGLALSTANLYSAVQPGGSLYGLQASNPVDTGIAYAGESSNYGQANDPMVGRKIGGVNVFGGGLGLYAAGANSNQPAVLVGAVGVSGDTSCTDHDIAWRVRNNLNLDHLSKVGGVSGDNKHPDNIIYDITANAAGGTGVSHGGFGHPGCLNYNATPTNLPNVQ
jgi:uncharacterized protein GlcG (DUF336 family)